MTLAEDIDVICKKNTNLANFKSPRRMLRYLLHNQGQTESTAVAFAVASA